MVSSRALVTATQRSREEDDALLLEATLGLGTNHTVNTIAERDALTNLGNSDKVFVRDIGTGKWGHYLVESINPVVFSVIMTEDTYLNSNSKEQIKTAYESNPNTNPFTDAERVKLASTEITSQLNIRDTANRNTDNHTDGLIKAFYTLAERAKLLAIEANAKDDQIASEVPYNNTTTGLVSANLQAAVDELHTLAITIQSSLSGYLGVNAQAVDSNKLNGQLAAFYQDASNLITGTISDTRLPASITSNITGNAATATILATARSISVAGAVTGVGVSFDGSGNIVLNTVQTPASIIALV